MGAKPPLMVPSGRGSVEVGTAKAPLQKNSWRPVVVDASWRGATFHCDRPVDAKSRRQDSSRTNRSRRPLFRKPTVVKPGSFHALPRSAQRTDHPDDDDRGRQRSPTAPESDFAAPSLPQKSMRVMVSRGTADLGGAKAGGHGELRSRGPKPSGPMIAEIPRYKAPPSAKIPKPEEATPQKPVQRFNADSPTKEAPLGPILRKRPDATSKKKPGDDEPEDLKAKKHIPAGRRCKMRAISAGKFR